MNDPETFRYGENDALTLKDDVATVSALVRRVPLWRLREPRFGDWNALEVMAHVTRVAEVVRGRIERCVREDAPAVPAIPEGDLVAQRDPLALARQLGDANAAIVELLREPGATERPATHPEWGSVSAGYFGARHARHAHEHVTELSRGFPPG